MNKPLSKKITAIIPSLPDKDPEQALETLKKTDYPLDKIEVMITKGKNPSRQRNQAIDRATGNIIFFFDDDSEIPKDYFKKALEHYEDETIDAIGGPAETSRTAPFLQKCFGYVIGSYFATQSMSNKFHGHGKVREATEKELILCNFNIRKESLGKNRFDERLYPNEENELFNRLKSEGKNFLYDPNLKIYRYRRKSILNFAKQFYKYGYGRIEHLIIRPRSFSPVFIIPPLFVIYLLLLIGLIFMQKAYPIYFIPLALYLLITIGSAAKIAITEKDPKTILITPPLFLIVHTSYGIGMITSLLNFRKTERPKEVKVTKIKLK
ncbi:MAG: glycosyltransferase [Nanoarchaeota archaeon]